MPTLEELYGKHGPRRYRGTYLGTVVNNSDPEERGRIKVKCPEIYGNAVSPWIEYGSGYGGFGDGGFFFVPELGSSVRIVFKNGEPDNPLYDGSVTPKKSVPNLARGKKDRTRDNKGKLNFSSFIDDSDAKEPDDQYKSVYPHNKTIKTRSHLIELDDTPGAERVNIHHKSGSGIELYPDGTTLIMTRKDKFETIEQKSTLNAKGEANYKFDKSVGIIIDQNGNIKILGDLSVYVKGNLNLTSEAQVIISGRDGVTISSRDDVSIIARNDITTSAKQTKIIDSD